MNQFKNRSKHIVLLLPLAMVIAGTLGWLLLYGLLPSLYFRWYPLIPAYFISLGLLVVTAMNYYSKSKPSIGLMIYLFLRVVKMILTAGFVYLYYLIVGRNMTATLVTTSIFYLLFLFVETSIFFRLGKTPGTDAPSN
ncbi:MAG: hypothetical protein FWD56_07120 [Bacteroidales bacterium]|nr:hypothetical protein [Bacteroidales bacterium]